MALVGIWGAEAMGRVDAATGANGTCGGAASDRPNSARCYRMTVSPASTGGSNLSFGGNGLNRAASLPVNNRYLYATAYFRFPIALPTGSAGFLSIDGKIPIYYDLTTGNLQVRTGLSGGLLLHTSSFLVVAATWYRAELFVDKGDNNKVTYTVNLYDAANVDGVTPTDTWSGTYNSLNSGTVVDYLIAGKQNSSNLECIVEVDDISISTSAFSGPSHVVNLAATADGTNAQFAAGAGDGDYRDIDDFPSNDGDTTYLSSNNSNGQAETPKRATCAAAGIPSGSAILGIVGKMYAKPSSTAADHAVRYRDAGGVVDGSKGDMSSTTQYECYSSAVRETDSLGAAWTQAQLDTLECGSKDLGGATFRLTATYVEVLYTEPPAGGIAEDFGVGLF